MRSENNLAKYISIILLVGFVAVGFSSGSVKAGSLTISSGIAVGATGVSIGADTYNVTFYDGTCAGIYGGCSDFAFTSPTQADLASTALFNLFADPIYNLYDDDPTKTFGINWPIYGQLITPWTNDGTNWLASIFVNRDASGTDFIGSLTLPSFYTTADAATRVFAEWTKVSVVPLPPSAILFGSALLGLAGVKRWKRNASPS